MSKKSQYLLAGLFLASWLTGQGCSQTAFDSSGDSSGQGGSNPGDAGGTIRQVLSSLQPAMAVRSANCINCHGNSMASSLITDFGHGDSYFFGLDNTSPNSGDWVYALRITADQTSSEYLPTWAAAQQYAAGASIIVPNVNLGFQYHSYAPSWVPAASWLRSTSLPDLVTQIEAIPGAGNTPVIAKSSVYIGAPGVSQLRIAGGINPSHPLKYYPNDSHSAALAGFSYVNAGYYTNTGVVSCDGDLFVDGTVFLNSLILATDNGCRLHATGPIFVQKGITYTSPATNPNLQLVSSRLISMGVGLTNCEATTNPAGWYNTTKVADPMLMRLVMMADPTDTYYKDIRTRNVTPSSGFEQTAVSPVEEGRALFQEAAKIQGLDDASCHGREVSFTHLLLVAPLLHSRYTGGVSGVIIGEFPLFSLGAFSYAFDPVFQTVPVLPRIPSSEYLVVR